MKLKTLFFTAIIVAIAIGFAACNGNKNREQTSNDAQSQVVDNKDEVTFLKSFLMCNHYLIYNPKATTTVISTRLSSAKGIRYFHSSFSIWSTLRRGNVQRTHMSSQTRGIRLLPDQKLQRD